MNENLIELLIQEEKERERLQQKMEQNILPSVPKESSLTIQWEGDIPSVHSTHEEEKSFLMSILDSPVSSSPSTTFTTMDLFDFTIPLENRMEHLMSLSLEERMEMIYKLIHIFTLNPISIVKQFLTDVSSSIQVPLSIRIDCARAIRDLSRTSEEGRELLYSFFPIYDPTIPVSVQVSLAMELIKDYPKEMVAYVKEIVNQTSPHRPPMNKECFKILCRLPITPFTKEYIQEIAFAYLFHTPNPIPFRIMTCQYIVQTFQCNQHLIEDYLLTLIEELKNHPENENLIADALDVMLHFQNSSSAFLTKIQSCLLQLGKGKTIYENSQNVHMVQESVYQEVEKLFKKTSLFSLPSFENLLTLWKEKKEYPEIEESLYRVEVDTTLFKLLKSQTTFLLKDLFVRVCAFISQHPSKEELEKRWIEELMETTGTCSSGYVSRFINTLSGFDGFGIRIQMGEEFDAIFTHRLHSRLTEQMIEDLAEKKYTLSALDSRLIADVRNEMYLLFIEMNPTEEEEKKEEEKEEEKKEEKESESFWLPEKEEWEEEFDLLFQHCMIRYDAN